MNTQDSIARLARLLLHVTYKEGWKLVPSIEPDEPELTIYRSVPSSHPPHEVGMILSKHDVDMSASDAGILRTVYDGIIEAETHEVREWFRVDGEAVFDPHREDVPEMAIDERAHSAGRLG